MVDIIVFGSINMDIIVKTPTFPLAGETMATQEYAKNLGGKAANQACACAKLGKNTVFSACVGDDNFGETLVKEVKALGVDIHHIKRITDTNTDIAFVNVCETGQNKIITTLNTNYAMTRGMVDELDETFVQASAVVLQMEMPASVGEYILEKAKQHKCLTIFNQAPVNRINKSSYQNVDVLVVNEIEAGQLADMDVNDVVTAKSAAVELLAFGCKSVVITLGDQGAVVRASDEQQHIPAYEVENKDTTAAGDSFVGALAVQMSNGKDIVEAVRFATAVSAIAVSREGAAKSIPTKAEVEDFLRER